VVRSGQIIPVLISGTKYGRILNKNLYNRAFTYFGKNLRMINFKKEKKNITLYVLYVLCLRKSVLYNPFYEYFIEQYIHIHFLDFIIAISLIDVYSRLYYK
jgi:hypothetical protein